MFHLEANLLTPKESFLLETASGGTPRWHDWFSYKVSGDNLVEGSTNGLRLRDSEWTWNKEPYLGTFGTYMSHKWFLFLLYRAVGPLVDILYHTWYIGGVFSRHLLDGSCLRGKGWA